MCVCIYMYIHTHIYIHICIYKYLYTYMYIYIYIYICVYIYIYIFIYTFSGVLIQSVARGYHANTHMYYVFMHTHVYIYMNICMYICSCICFFIQGVARSNHGEFIYMNKIYICIYIYIYICIYVCMYIYIYIYIYLYGEAPTWILAQISKWPVNPNQSLHFKRNCFSFLQSLLRLFWRGWHWLRLRQWQKFRVTVARGGRGWVLFKN